MRECVFVLYEALHFIAISPFHSKFSSHNNCQHMRRIIQKPDVNVQSAKRCPGSTTKRIAARRPSNDLIETAIDKLEEIGSDSEAGPPLPPRPPMSRQRFSLSMETGKHLMMPRNNNNNNLKIESIVNLSIAQAPSNILDYGIKPELCSS